MAKKILLIEYEPRYLDRIRGFLAGKDFDLVVAKDGEDGLEAYGRGRPDLVLISTVLPKLRTRDVIKGMQATGPTPPILLMTSGYKGKNKAADAQREGATGILEKPFNEDSFLTEINEAIGGRAVFPSAAGPAPAGSLLSSDDIFSDVLSGMEEEAPAKPAAPVGTDPGIQRKLEQTLSGILQSPKRSGSSSAGLSRPEVPAPAAPAPKPAPAAPPASSPAPEKPAEKVGDRTLRVDIAAGLLGSQAPAPSPVPASPRPQEKPAPKIDSAVDRMLSDTLSGLRTAKAPSEKSGERPVPAPRPAEPVRAPLPEKPAPAPRPEPVRPAPAPVPPAAPPAPAPKVEKKDERRRSEGPSNIPASFGRYQMLEKIAAGGMAEVFKARMRGEEGFEKIVAIKRILPHMADNDDFITMFIDEAKLAAQLTHNNIIHIYDLGKVDQYHYIAMEYVDGKDLRSILKLGQDRGYPLPPELALFVASKIANALDYAHRRVGLDGKELNLVHRDVSPQNILISFEGDIKLCDFGIAKAATKVSQTQTGALKGKLQYMSPEQAWGKKIDRRTDIFSLGIVLFEMLTGERLFNGDTDLTILEQVRDARVSAPSEKNPDVPKRVDQIVLKALAKEQKDRYQNASEMEKELNSVLYSFQPAPGPADLAIYMHRLVESGSVASDASIDAAFASVEAAPMPVAEPAKKGKGLVISKKATAPAEVAERRPEPVSAPARPVEVSAPATVGAEEGKSRTGLFVGIGLAAVVLIAGGVYLAKGKGTQAPAPVATPAPAPEVPASTSPAPPASAAPEAVKKIDEKALEAEVKRQAAEQAKALREAATKGQAAPAPQPTAPAAGVSLSPSKPLQPPKPADTPVPAPVAKAPEKAPEPVRPTPEPPKAAEPAPRPTPVSEPAPRAPEPSTSVAVKEGDLVGPGEGVVEPRLVKLGAFAGLPPQARQIQTKRGEQGIGTPLIMALITEQGTVSEVRVLKPSSYKFVDDAAVSALKNSKIEPATKNGTKVKMWKTFAITVKP